MGYYNTLYEQAKQFIYYKASINSIYHVNKLDIEMSIMEYFMINYPEFYDKISYSNYDFNIIVYGEYTAYQSKKTQNFFKFDLIEIEKDFKDFYPELYI